MTTMGDALERAGYSKAEMEIYAALIKFIRSGGTREALLKVYERAATAMPGEGHDLTALAGHLAGAYARQPLASGSGHQPGAPEGHMPAAPPAREPSPAYLRAVATSRQEAARTVLDLKQTSDGRAWGDVHPYELGGMQRDGAIAKAVKAILGELNSAQRRMSLRELLTPEQFQDALARAERHNDDD